MARKLRLDRDPGVRRLDWLAVGLPLAVLYGFTVSRDLGVIDSGELATVCARLGIAHPTGYPLYTLIGRVLTEASPLSPIVTLNLFSSAAALVAAVLAVSLVRGLLGSGSRPESRSGSGFRREFGSGSGPGFARGSTFRWVPLAAGLWLGTDLVLWQQATGNEVYSLHLLFTVLLLTRLLRLLEPPFRARDLLGTAYLLGLMFAHHLSVVFLLPAAAAALGTALRGPPDARRKLRWLAGAAGFFLLGWSVVLYLPIRSAAGPVLDWGAPSGWAAFWRHTLADQYHVWFLESSRGFIENLAGYLTSLPGRLSWPVVLLALPGLGSLLAASRARFLVLGLVWVVTVIWASGYEIHDLEPYYLPADLAVVGFAACGLDGLARRFLPALRPAGVGAAALLLAVLQTGLHFEKADHRNDRLIRTHAEILLDSLPPDCILLSRFWDAVVSPSIYLQAIEGRRRDVAVVDTELLRRSWYFPQLRRWDPGLLAPVEPRVSEFLRDLRLFESGRPYDAVRIERNYRAVIDGIARSHRPGRPTAFTPDVDRSDLEGLMPVPEGLVLVARDDPASAPALDPPDVERLLASGLRPEDPIHQTVLAQWKTMLELRIQFLTRFGREAEVAPWRRALERLSDAATAGP